MNALANNDVSERIGNFLDQYIRLTDGVSQIPRNIPFFKDGFRLLIETGLFPDVYSIKLACLIQEHQIIPDFLFDGIEKK